jgi:hypothetical protein
MKFDPPSGGNNALFLRHRQGRIVRAGDLGEGNAASQRQRAG